MKGSFFTLSGFLLVSLILVLSILYSQTLNQSNDRLMEAGSLERISSLERSLGRTIKEMDNGIDISLERIGEIPILTQINITETINSSFEEYGSDFYDSILDLKSYLESDQQEIILNPDILYSPNEKIPILFKPHNIKYSHYNSNDKINVKITTDVVSQNYELYLHLLNEKINHDRNIEWIIQNPVNESTINKISLTIIASDYDGYTTNISKNISNTEHNQFRVSGCEIDFNTLTPSSIDIDYDKPYIISLLTIPIALFEEVTANYPAGLVLMNFTEINIFKNRTVRIA
ncbi:MAG: hypothetical protein ABIH25_00755 [Candidatus Woesearchaeota archaeon]